MQMSPKIDIKHALRVTGVTVASPPGPWPLIFLCLSAIMFSRLIPRPTHFRLLAILYLKPQSYLQPGIYNLPPLLELSRLLSSESSSSNGNNNNKDQSTLTPWKLSHESDSKSDLFFNEESGDLAGFSVAASGEGESWTEARGDEEGDVFGERGEEFGVRKDDDGWLTADGFEPWSLGNEEKDELDTDDIRDAVSGGGGCVGEIGGDSVKEREKKEEQAKLQKEETELTTVLKGPNRVFGDLISASGITDAMLDSLIALRNLEDVSGLPPLREIEDIRYEKNTRKSTRAEIERQKQEEIARSRVRRVDEKGRAYGTGRRKCAIARVWVQPGEGKFIVNDKEFDVYFPLLDHRAALLRPFSETKTLGLWDIKCTVKGGGVTGQVGAIQLGISRALQNWEPGLRPLLKNAGFLTRDPRVVERKKPGKAKARKSFQWVKR